MRIFSFVQPEQEYQARRDRWAEAQKAHDQRHRRLGSMRILFAIVLVVLAIFIGRAFPTLVGVSVAVIAVGLFFSGKIHDHILNLRETAWRGVRFNQAGLDRIAGKWMGQGSPGTEFLDPRHPYAIDLDLFGAGSVFELVNRAQTRGGRETLAQWLLQRAPVDDIRARQGAVAELRPKLDLRESLALLASNPNIHIDTKALITWAAAPSQPASAAIRIFAFCVPLATWSVLFLLGNYQLATGLYAAQLAIAYVYRKRVKAVFDALNIPSRDLIWLAEIFQRLESETFQSARLQQLQAGWNSDGLRASECLRRLAKLLDLLDSRDHFIPRIVGPFFLLNTQLAFTLESRRAAFGHKIEGWLRDLGEMEALSSLAGHACEHPLDIFPEMLPESHPLEITTEGLGHPCIPEARVVRNDFAMGEQRRLVVISGSNMSGKSTWLRALGVNIVLAQAGGPVRARRLQLTPLNLGASIRTMDSLNEGISRFYAEIQRLRQILDLTAQPGRVFFLVDEILQGTNSHDRRIGAAGVVKTLLDRGAIGLITTHDLALTQVADEVQPRGVNFHFEDQLSDGKMSFDYCLRPGIVEKSNALALMRSIGLEV